MEFSRYGCPISDGASLEDTYRSQSQAHISLKTAAPLFLPIPTSNQFGQSTLDFGIEDHSFLPLEPQDQEQDNGTSTDFIFEPSQEDIVAELIPKSLKTQLFKALRDSVASEHGARMTAMHKATDNAKELKDSLTLEYNKARQAAITNEILEIVGGAEALAG